MEGNFISGTSTTGEIRVFKEEASSLLMEGKAGEVVEEEEAGEGDGVGWDEVVQYLIPKREAN